jgi:hypothetical protein
MRFILFVGSDYYPRGGAEDAVAVWDHRPSVEEILSQLAKRGAWLEFPGSWAHLWDLSEDKIVERYRSGERQWFRLECEPTPVGLVEVEE